MEEEIITLNVGGQIFSTYKSNLTQTMTNKDTNQSEENYFNELFKHPETIQRDENQNIFIDRDPTYFRYILNYLRNFGDLEKCFFPDEEKELKELIEETKFYGLTNFTNFLSERNFIFLGSHILNLELSSMLSSFFPNKKWKSVYRATRDGFDALSFHSCCDGIGPSIVLILTTNGWIFGGYTSKPWRSHGGFFKDEECFLFSLVTPKRQKKYKLNLLNKQASEYAVFYSNEKSACFGAVNSSNDSFFNLGCSSLCK